MRPSATAFFRDVRFPSHAQDKRAHEVFLLDTLAERKAKERAPLWPRLVRAARSLRWPARA